MQKISLHIFQKTLIVFCIFFLLITLAYEIFYKPNSDFLEWNNNVVFALDVSQSMNVWDMWDYTRLDAAKRKIIDIIRENPENNYALNIFAGESLRILPFTNDIGLISTFLLWLDSRNITKQWTDIPWALDLSYESFNELQSWQVILLTDGSDDAVNISSDIKNNYRDKNLELIVLWVWSSQGWYIPSNSPLNPYKIYNGEVVISSLNTSGLQEVAEDMNGKYINIDQYVDYTWIWSTSSPSSFPFIFLLFVASWWVYLIVLYRNIFLKHRY